MDFLILETFSFISFAFVALCLFLTNKYIKPQHRKYVFIGFSILTVFLHYSSFLFQVITGNTPTYIPGNLFLPEWPCNVIMWLVFVSIFLILFDKNKVSQVIYDICFWIGAPCAVFGLVINFNFLGNPNLLDYDILKGLLSHVTLLYCCVFLFVEKYTNFDSLRIGVSAIIGCILFIVCANYSRLINIALGRGEGGTMLESPFDSLPWLNLYVICIGALLLYTIGITIYELICYPKDKLWFNKIKNYFRKGEK